MPRGIYAWPRPTAKVDPVTRFWMKTRRVRDCLIWCGSKRHNGYGQVNWKGRITSAHRVAWLLAGRDLPTDRYEGQFDHLCRNRACVNVDHLEIVSQPENNRRSQSVTARNGRKTHCKHGHPFDVKNTRFRKNGGRVCRRCHCLSECARQKVSK